MRTNDGNVDPQGRFWIGTMAIDEPPGKGALYRYAAGELATRPRADRALQRPRLDREGRMYYVDTPTKRVDVLDYDGDAVADRRRSRTSRRASACPTAS